MLPQNTGRDNMRLEGHPGKGSGVANETSSVELFLNPDVNHTERHDDHGGRNIQDSRLIP